MHPRSLHVSGLVGIAWERLRRGRSGGPAAQAPQLVPVVPRAYKGAYKRVCEGAYKGAYKGAYEGACKGAYKGAYKGVNKGA